MTSNGTAAVAGAELDRILRERLVRTMFQPIVHLESGAAVGFEALVRGPEGSSLESADSLFDAAYAAGRVAELDWVARASACHAALAAGLDPEQLLCLNVEPLALDSECRPDLWPDIERAFGMFRVVLEITERTLDRDPGLLLDALDRVRPTVVGFALDDVGSTDATLSMLPLVSPAIIKLDRKIVQGEVDDQTARVLTTAYDEAERTGATLLNEGIETARHASLARSFGATLGQGYFFGPPSWQPEPGRALAEPMRLQAETPALIATPFDALRGNANGRASAELLAPIGRHLEPYVADLTAPALLICLFPDPDLFGPDDRRRLSDLARRGVLTAVLGPGLPSQIGDGIRGAGLRGEPDITNEWAVVVLSSCSAGAMLARADPESPNEFEFGVTHDPARVVAAARCLFRRLGHPVLRMRGRLS